MARNRSNNNTIKRRLCFPAVITISDPGMNKVITRFFKVLCRLFAQLFNNFYGIHTISKLGENSRLIPRTGADFQNPIRFFQLKQISHDRDDIRLGNGLPITNWEWPVFIRIGTLIIRNKFMSWYLAYGIENPFI